MARTTVGTYQMLWDCPSCGTTGLLALDHRHCPTCGSAQDPARRYYPTDAQKVAVEDHPFHGADRLCPACESPNAAKATCCVNCGSPLDGAKAVQARAEKDAAAADSAAEAAKEADAKRAEARGAAQARTAAASGVPAKSGRGAIFAVVGCLAFVVLAVVGLFAGEALLSKSSGATVAAHAWERTAEVQVFKAVQESDWRSGVPSGARGVTCRQEQHGTKNVPDGQDCTNKNVDHGDGTFSTVKDCTPRYRAEPVYDDKCSYTIDKWVTANTLRASGSGVTPAPAWPASAPDSPTQRTRHGSETYTLALQLSDGSSADCTLDESTWASFADGAGVAVELGGLTGRVDCDSLRAP